MTLSIWRYAHLALAIVSSVFLFILSVTGIILAVDAVKEKQSAHKVSDFETITLAESLPLLLKEYPEIVEITVDHNQSVKLDALDKEGNEVKAYIDPRSGKILGKPEPQSQFIQWTTALHRSLFLKEPGRIIVGVVSFLLFLITISGIVLIVRRQQGVRHFFAKINRDVFEQYLHVTGSRLLLIPILALALTGTYLFMVRIEIIKGASEKVSLTQPTDHTASRPLAAFPIFRETKLADVEKIEFPFVAEDPEEFFVLKLKDRMVTVHQISGEIVAETKHPYTAALDNLSLDIHTGRTNAIWAIILGIASLNILFSIYTGFVITFKRTRTSIKNRFRPDNAEIVLLVGTENGSTLFFAHQIHSQLLADGKKSYLTELNRFGRFPSATHVIVFTSTYGLGTAPTNGKRFERLLVEYPQKQPVKFSVVGFGSKAYKDFCAYAVQVDELLGRQSWASRYLELFNVNDKSTDDFVEWVHAWSEKSLVALATAPAVYQRKAAGLKKLSVVEKTPVSEDNSTFLMLLKPEDKVSFRSGDLLAIYPVQDSRERFYSIGSKNGMIQLVVKLYTDGLGSGFLYALEKGSTFKGRVVSNTHFHFPDKAHAVVMIANGTGIAPFLGMISCNHQQVPIHLYAGFRYDNDLIRDYRQFASEETAKNHLSGFHIAFSRGEHPQYVMDLIRRDALFFADLLSQGGVIMICGSLSMHKDVEMVLEKICRDTNNSALKHYVENRQILTDCY